MRHDRVVRAKSRFHLRLLGYELSRYVPMLELGPPGPVTAGVRRQETVP
jgi:hypothetical protein